MYFFFFKINPRYEATDMNLFRSALSACVVVGVPNLNDYIHQHRDRLMEEKRQKLLALQQQQQAALEAAAQQEQENAQQNNNHMGFHNA
jgi:kelch-like protein 10